MILLALLVTVVAVTSSDGCVMETEGGNSNGACCAFPFLYNGQELTACSSDNSGRPWCGTTYNYDADSKWGYCKIGVSCGHHRASNCAGCPQGHGASYCNGDCKWCSGGLTGAGSCHARDAACPVNGAWSSWGSYGSCSKTCGAGVETRSRYCDHPAPANGGTSCSGSGHETRPCNHGTCAVNGAWGAWGSYGSCSKTCGGGVQTRSRYCNNPAPSNGGASCPGLGHQNNPCNAQGCPVNGGWGRWGSYGRCSKSCGYGTRTRSRSCNNPAPANGGSSCSGSSTESQRCRDRECQGRTYECRWLSGSFGKTLTCPSSYVATGACGSGALGDCGFFIWTKLKCCRITSGTNSNCATRKGGFGSVLTCPNQMVVRSLCESGAAGNCGWFIWNRITCCTIQGHSITSSCRWKYGTYGAHLTCDGGQIMTGACGSGTGLDCPNRTAHGIKCCNFQQ